VTMATRPSNLIVMRDSRFLVVMPGLDPRLSGSFFAVQGARH
jgi:hypothetical protein